MTTNLKMEITRRGLRQTRIAADLGMNAAVLNQIVNGYARPRPAQLATLVRWATEELGWPAESVMDLFEEARPR